MKVLATAIIGLFLALATAQQVHAHALQPGYLELQLLGGENWRAFWRKPTVQNKPMAIDVALPENCTERTPPSPVFDGAAWVAQWVTTCPGGLAGGVIAIPGLEVTRTDVLVRYELSPGAGQARRLTPAQPSFVVPADPGFLDVWPATSSSASSTSWRASTISCSCSRFCSSLPIA